MEIDTQVSDLQEVVSRDYGEPSSPIGTGFLPENFILPTLIDLPSYAAAARPPLKDNQNFVPAHDKENELPSCKLLFPILLIELRRQGRAGRQEDWSNLPLD